MAALIGEVSDPTGQSNERCVASADVSDTQLGHREIERRMPGPKRQRDRGDEQRQTHCVQGEWHMFD